MAETQTAHTEVPSEGRGKFPPFDRETLASQLFWLFITFVLLYVVMAKIALPRIGGIIETRRARIDGDLTEADRLKGDTDKAMADYEAALAAARSRAHAIAAEQRDALNAEAEQRRKTLEGELNAKLAAADQAIAATKTRAMANVRDIATDAAATIVSRLTGAAPADTVVAGAVDAVLKR